MAKKKEAAPPNDDTQDDTDSGEPMSAKIVDMKEATAIGTLVTIILDQVKSIPRSWQELSEEEQEAYINRIHRQCQHAVRQMAQVISTKGCQYISCEIDSVQFKDGGKVVLKFPGKADGRHELADRAGGYCTVVLQNWEFLNCTEGLPTADPDQGTLELVTGATAEQTE